MRDKIVDDYLVRLLFHAERNRYFERKNLVLGEFRLDSELRKVIDRALGFAYVRPASMQKIFRAAHAFHAWYYLYGTKQHDSIMRTLRVPLKSTR
jgi:hypothetical protein